MGSALINLTLHLLRSSVFTIFAVVIRGASPFGVAENRPYKTEPGNAGVESMNAIKIIWL